MTHLIRWTQVLAFILFALMATSFAQTTVKVQGVVGEVTFQKQDKSNWQPVRVGVKLKESDKLRTGVESQATLLFENGSVVTISENSIIALEKLDSKGEDSQTRLGVKTGKVLFNVRKLASGRSSFEFQAKSATAAIRGTDGEFRVNGFRTFASLNTGRLELRSEKGGASIVGGQLVIQTQNGFLVLKKPENPEELLKLIETYMSDSAVVDSGAGLALPDSLLADTTMPDSTVTGADTIHSGLCKVNAVPAQTSLPKLEISGSAPAGATVVMGNLRVQVANSGEWTMSLAWDAAKSGPRSYEVKAVDGENEMTCGVVAFEYIAPEVPLTLNLQTPNPVTICRGPLVIRGQYAGTGARLMLKLAGQTLDLSSLNGQFSKTIEVSDRQRNWDLEGAELIVGGASGTMVKELQFQVDRKCKEVNTIAPIVELASVPGSCMAMATVGQIDGDEAEVMWLSDGVELSRFTTTDNVRGKRMDLEEGVHQYTLRAVDLAGNKSEAKLSNIACWPDVRFDIRLEGVSKESIRIPPGPPGKTGFIRKTIRFAVDRLPRDDYRYIKRVTVRYNGLNVKEWRDVKITSSEFEHELELNRKTSNIILIEVELQNGRIRTAQKEFEIK